MQKLLTADEVRIKCDLQQFDGIQNISDKSIKEIIGQARAIKALKLGLGIKAQGFNIYVSGAAGTGKLTAVANFVTEQAKNEPAAPDWCYVNNFKDSYRPEKLSLPAGNAVQFKKDMKVLIQDIYNALVKVFESEEYAGKKEKIINAFEAEQAHILGQISKHAEEQSFTVKQTPTSIVTIPLKNGRPLTEEEVKNLTEEELDIINKKQDKIQEEVSAALREIRKQEKATNENLDSLSREVAEYATDNLIEDLNDKYHAITQVKDYLQALKADILENLPEFIMSQKKASPLSPETNDGINFLKRYEVTVLVDNDPTKGAPVITERNPTYNNLLGRVEKESHMGTLVTDFTMIRKGSLHSANSGYLIIRIEELLKNYFAWECIKRALKNKEIVIEEATDQLGYLTTRSLKPASIPLNVKVILIGNSYYYQLLYQYDNDFRELFKIKADFDNTMDRTEQSIKDYIASIKSMSYKEKLLPSDNSAMEKVIEYGSKLAQDQYKLSTRLGAIADILREANYYAEKEQSKNISGSHIQKAIEEKVYRSNLIQEKINEMITTRQIFIDISGNKTGQINGLSVIDIGDVAFGIPARITCSISMGKEGVIAIEREAEMSGPIHTKGVLILSGYIASKFLQDKPVSLAARLVFEQSYSEVEGDSASSTELYAILSTLANLPIKQGIAVTGSVNQKGEIQPIGGVNEKIEGYFEICRRIGFNGEQGVIIPAANMRNLMLKEEIVEAIKQNKFRIWAVDTIEDGIEILTGVKAGSIWEDGTAFFYVNNALELFAEKMREFSGGEEELVIENK